MRLVVVFASVFAVAASAPVEPTSTTTDIIVPTLSADTKVTTDAPAFTDEQSTLSPAEDLGEQATDQSSTPVPIEATSTTGPDEQTETTSSVAEAAADKQESSDAAPFLILAKRHAELSSGQSTTIQAAEATTSSSQSSDEPESATGSGTLPPGTTLESQDVAGETGGATAADGATKSSVQEAEPSETVIEEQTTELPEAPAVEQELEPDHSLIPVEESGTGPSRSYRKRASGKAGVEYNVQRETSLKKKRDLIEDSDSFDDDSSDSLYLDSNVDADCAYYDTKCLARALAERSGSSSSSSEEGGGGPNMFAAVPIHAVVPLGRPSRQVPANLGSFLQPGTPVASPIDAAFGGQPNGLNSIPEWYTNLRKYSFDLLGDPTNMVKNVLYWPWYLANAVTPQQWQPDGGIHPPAIIPWRRTK